MRKSSCWLYTPHRHKTEHHDQERLILIGPRAQEVLRPFLGVKLDAYCFSAAESERQRNAKRRQERKSPMTPSQAKRKPKQKRERAPREHYTTCTYRRAIKRACNKAERKAHKDNPSLAADQRIVPVWTPNRLRHTRGTELRRHGIDLAKTVLGHTKVETTEIYAEKDLAAAIELVAKIG
jgi:site-specific recombinase XerD